MTYRRSLLAVIASLLLAVVLLSLRAPAHSPDAVSAAPAAIGGPDDYGYTWDDAIAVNWIDATGGTEAELSNGGLSAWVTDAIPIGFDFPFYENIYASIYISSAGAAGFDQSTLEDQSDTLGFPSPDHPDNFIAVLHRQLYFDRRSPELSGRVYYLRGGSAPNRTFVVQWQNLEDLRGGHYTFQMILRENGDIRLQYDVMVAGNWFGCNPTTGIEGPSGVDGLAYVEPGLDCPDPEQLAHRAILFRRPAPAARVQLFPEHYGTHVPTGGSAAVQLHLKNTGNAGADRYDLAVSPGWPLDLYHADGVSPLADTDGSGLPDTGLVFENEERTIVAVVHAPDTATVGDHHTFQVDVISARDSGAREAALLRTAVPAPFAQVYHHHDQQGGLGLYLSHPAGQASRAPGPAQLWSAAPAVAETPDHNFVYVWNADRCLDTCLVYVRELYFTILDRFGRTVVPVHKLTEHGGADLRIVEDNTPVVAVAPDGTIGIIWSRSKIDLLQHTESDDVYFVTLDGQGNVTHGPINMNPKQSWVPQDEFDVLHLSNPQLVALKGNRFFLAWESEQLQPPAGDCTAYCYLHDVAFAIYGADGTQFKGATTLTDDTPVRDYGYVDPGLVPLGGDRVLLTFVRYGDEHDLYYALLDSDGATLQAIAPLTANGADLWEYRPDGVQLANGNLVVAWTESHWQNQPAPTISYAVFDAGLEPLAAPASLATLAAPTGGEAVSVTRDGANHAIFTWQGSGDYQRHLYYALLGADGSLLTPATIFRSGEDATSITTAATGYGNTTYTYSPPAGVNGVVSVHPERVAVLPGGSPAVTVSYVNGGMAQISGAVLSATLPAGVTYLSDSSGLQPSVTGNTVSWNLPPLSFLAGHDFSLQVALPETAEVGQRYLLTFALETATVDVDPANNSATVEVVAIGRLLFPTVRLR